MNDRLAELKKKAPPKQHTAIDVAEPGGDKRAGSSSKKSSGQSPEMAQFFKDVELVKRNILAIKDATKKMEDIKQQIVLSTTTEREKELSEELGPLIKDNNAKATLAKQLLQKLRENTERMKSASKPGAEADVRIRENLANTLTRKFVDVMKEYQNTQQKFKTEIKKKVKRHFKIVKPDATSEEIDAVLNTGGGSGEVFKNAILQGDASDSVRNAYMNVQDKYQDVLALEASMQELADMFRDFAMLTEQQGELLDQIEYQVKAASDYIDEGNANMEQAIEYAKSIKKQQCICFVIFLVIVGVILAVLAMQGYLG